MMKLATQIWENKLTKIILLLGIAIGPFLIELITYRGVVENNFRLPIIVFPTGALLATWFFRKKITFP
jgi:hypothetical protein